LPALKNVIKVVLETIPINIRAVERFNSIRFETIEAVVFVYKAQNCVGAVSAK